MKVDCLMKITALVRSQIARSRRARSERALTIARLGVALCLAAALVAPMAGQGSIRIRLGTVVPKGSLWHETLLRLAQDWRKIVGPRLELTIYPGGQLGDELEMVRQARQGRIQAVGLSSVGLSRIDSSVACLQVPMLLDSYAALDYVRDRVAPDLEKRIEAQGFKVLHWADGGWVYAFSKQPARTPGDLRRMKLFTASGDPDTESLYKNLGFNVVPLSLTDLITSLQTGMLDAFATVPLFAQLQESYKLAPNMTNVRWTPLVGGTIIALRAWDSLPDEHKAALLDAAHKQGNVLRGEIRRMDEVAIQEMQKRGLKVIDLDAASRREWQTEAERAYPQLRGRYCPADMFDRVVRLRDEFRKSAAGASAAQQP
jgi:TRAP-type C4-dicarboxylate transport system substrate-binding protein